MWLPNIKLKQDFPAQPQAAVNKASWVGLAPENLQHKGTNQNAGLTSRRKQELLTTCAPLAGGIWIGGGGAWCCHQHPPDEHKKLGERHFPPWTPQGRDVSINGTQSKCFCFLQRYVCNFITSGAMTISKLIFLIPQMSVALCCFWEWDILYSSKKTSKIHATSPPLT